MNGYIELKYLSGNSLSISDNCNVKVLADVFSALTRFADEQKGFNLCQVLSLSDFSRNDNNRIDIELLFQNVDYENKVIHNQLWQKVFYVDGEIYDCCSFVRRFHGN